MSDNLITHQLKNGLSLYLKEIHTAPIISTWIWYRIGSRNEKSGKTGLSHWVEHMQFKGTPRFSSYVLDKNISRLGGNWNAFTHMDFTTYFETLPAYAFETSLSLEADRMTNCFYDLEKVELERTVIISEREGAENNPLFQLGEAVQMAAFSEHPYRYEVIGIKSDLENISREDLFNHYHTYYQPANARICISGDFNAGEMIQKVTQFFEEIPSLPIPQVDVLTEPALTSEQRVEVSGPGETTFVQIVYRSPNAASQDFYGLTILDSLLSGPSGLNMFGSGGTSNKTSHLYQALVENEIAVSVHGSLQATIDPYLYGLNLTVHPQRTPEQVIQAVDDQIHKLQDHLVTESEISRAVKQAKALFAYGSENITNQGFWLGYANVFADYNWFIHYVDHLAMVTPQDIQRIAQTYLPEQNRVVGIYHPIHVEEAADAQ